MAAQDAETLFKKGLVALREGDATSAASLFESALKLETERGSGRNHIRYLSYHGLSVAQSRGVTPYAVSACRKAVKREPHNADLWLNLGRIYLLARLHDRALIAFDRGLKVTPSHPALKQELAKVERRRRPVLPFWHRDNPLNIWLGKLRARFLRWRFKAAQQAADAAIATGQDHPVRDRHGAG